MKSTHWRRKREGMGGEAGFTSTNVVPGLVNGPALWLAGPDALESVPQALKNLPQPWLLVGEFFLRQALQSRLIDPLANAGYDFSEMDWAGGQACESNVSRLMEKAKGFASIIALGGGKCLDTAKIAAERAGLGLVTIPTSAANCAAATPIAVLYDDEGLYLDTLSLTRAPGVCVIDSTFLAQAPVRYLAAGLSDTLAKWLEWDALPRSQRRGFGCEAGEVLAHKAYDLALKVGTQACQGECKSDFEESLEAIFLLSAQASSLGAGAAAAAHSFANGLSIIPAAREWLHGEQVALGLCFQHELLGLIGRPSKYSEDWKAALIKWKQPTEIPAAWLGSYQKALVQKILQPQESIHDLGRVDESMVASAIEALIHRGKH